jgi:eukaryotic-like serine/threonine-protein kinase
LIGRLLGPYEIVAKLGEGGMGEVYRARDARLNRDVALKVVPETFARDADRLARFVREAQVLASLNHPNIAALYGLEESDGQRALVLELVEGPTLADRIAKGAIALDEALAIARQICDALEAAHERGVIHRDLKPANVKLRPDGTVKVLDFGLAKAIVDPAGSSDGSQQPTITSPAHLRQGYGEAGTQVGVILGTAAYMSPEQARGRPVDRRADIWAFGVVLYEMLTGQRAFPGDEISDTLAGVLRADPDLRALPAETPAAIRRLLRRCLEKDRAQRLADAADARLEILEAPTDIVTGTATTRRPLRLAWGIAATLGLLSILFGVLLVRSQRRPSGLDAVYRSVILPPSGDVNLASADARTGRPRFGRGLALSPDGTRLALVAPGSKGSLMLWVYSLDGSGARALDGTEGASSPFWSPDGRSLAFVVDRKLKRIEAAGGPVQMVHDGARDFSTGTWNRDNVILFASDGPIYRVSADGGGASPVTTRDASRESPHESPFFLPDGRRFLYGTGLMAGNTAAGTVYVGSLDSTGGKKLFDGGFLPAYANGCLLFVRNDTLMAWRFDPDRLELAGEPAPLAEQLLVGGAPAAAGVFAVASSGVLAYQAGSIPKSELVWFDRNGTELRTLGEPQGFSYVQLSPDDQQIAVSVLVDAIRTRDIWLYDATRGARTRLTYDPSDDFSPVWSSKGDRLAFAGRRGDDKSLNLFELAVGGTGGEKRILDRDGVEIPTSWSPDGRFLLFQTPSPGADILALSLADQQVSSFATTPFTEGTARFSPDGQWVAYTSNETDRTEVYVAPFHGTGRRVAVSTTGGGSPRWRRDGKELYYIRTDNTLMAVPMTLGASSVEVGAAKSLFQTRFYGTAFPYDVSKDGRFVVNRSVGAAAASPITLIVNWPAMLKK